VEVIIQSESITDPRNCDRTLTLVGSADANDAKKTCTAMNVD
jgi:hypothetical protein